MALDKEAAFQLTRFASAFREARERGANESDTVTYLIEFFEDVLGYDSLKGETSVSACCQRPCASVRS